MADPKHQQQGNKQAANAPAKPTPAAAATAPEKSKRERFTEIAPKRTREILKKIETLGNCANKSGYEYTEADIEKIFGAIAKKVADVKAKFSATKGSKEEGFTL